MIHIIKEIIIFFLQKIYLVIECSYIVLRGGYLSFKSVVKGKRASFWEKINADVLICGNGPSLAEIDLEKVHNDGVEIAVVNYFPKYSEVFFDIKPHYLFLVDPVLFEKYNEKNKVLYEVLERVNWPLSVISLQGSQLNIENSYICSEYISCFSLSTELMTGFCDYLYEHNLVNHGAQDVINVALFYFLNKTKGNIYLAGMDMNLFKNFIIDIHNDVYLDNIHDYGMKRIAVHYDGVKKGEFFKILGFYQKIFYQYHIISEYAKRRKRTIRNLSMNSCLDMFEKINLTSWKK